ncbi:hypothetical protein BCR44DRAFT_1441978, partial [Catenaria anguillulae PL171]
MAVTSLGGMASGMGTVTVTGAGSRCVDERRRALAMPLGCTGAVLAAEDELVRDEELGGVMLPLPLADKGGEGGRAIGPLPPELVILVGESGKGRCIAAAGSWASTNEANGVEVKPAAPLATPLSPTVPQYPAVVAARPEVLLALRDPRRPPDALLVRSTDELR